MIGSFQYINNAIELSFHPQIILKSHVKRRRSKIYTIQGIDVSKWQGTMDWETALSAGIRFAFIKAGGASRYGYSGLVGASNINEVHHVA